MIITTRMVIKVYSLSFSRIKLIKESNNLRSGVANKISIPIYTMLLPLNSTLLEKSDL